MPAIKDVSVPHPQVHLEAQDCSGLGWGLGVGGEVSWPGPSVSLSWERDAVQAPDLATSLVLFDITMVMNCHLHIKAQMPCLFEEGCSGLISLLAHQLELGKGPLEGPHSTCLPPAVLWNPSGHWTWGPYTQLWALLQALGL